MNTMFSVIIATMNRLETMVETIASLERSSVTPDEIIILDQSTNDTVADDIKTLTEKSNLTFRYYHLEYPSLTHARNVGLQYAQNEILVFMDDDVSVEKDTFLNICHIMEDKTIAMIGGLDLLCGKGKNLFGYLFGFKSLFHRKYGGYVTAAAYGRYRNGISDTVRTEWAMGYFFVVRKSLIDQWKLEWDERFISYGYPEDLDFSYRYCKKAEKENMKCVLDPLVSVSHRVSQEWRETKTAVTYMQIINREYLTYKFEWPFLNRLATRWSNLGLFLQRCIHRDRPIDVLRAQSFCDRYRRDIKKGNLHTDYYT